MGSLADFFSGASTEATSDDFSSRLEKAKSAYKQQFGSDMPITSRARSREEQQRLYDEFKAGKKGVYMPIKYFKPVNSKLNNRSMDEFELIENLARGLRNLDIAMPTIYGIRPNDAQDLTNGWMTFDDFVQNELDALSEDTMNRLIVSDMEMKFQF